MLALKIIGIIFAALILLLIILLLLPVSVSLSWKNALAPEFELRFAGIKIPLDAKAKKNKKDSAAPRQSPISNLLGTNSPLEALKKIFKIASLIINRLGYLLPHIRLDRLHISYICADGDAAACALKYGAACAVAYPASALISTTLKQSEGAQKINIFCDFEKENDELEIDFKARIAFSFLFLAAAYIIINYTRYEIKTNI